MFLLFDVKVCHPNADWYRKMEPQLVYPIHENKKKRQYSRRISDVERGTFTPLVLTTTGGVGKYCLRFHCKLAELIASKRQEQYSTAISLIRAQVSFALLPVEEAPGTSKFSVTRKTISLVLMLLKEPSLRSFYRQFLHFSISDVLIKIENFQESANNWLNVGKSSAPKKGKNF